MGPGCVKNFSHSLGQLLTHAPQQNDVLFDYVIGAGVMTLASGRRANDIVATPCGSVKRARSLVRTDDPEREPVRVRRALDQEQGAGARERRRR
jgi:hypothetical protein